jgi:hypothetical protein
MHGTPPLSISLFSTSSTVRSSSSYENRYLGHISHLISNWIGCKVSKKGGENRSTVIYAPGRRRNLLNLGKRKADERGGG